MNKKNIKRSSNKKIRRYRGILFMTSAIDLTHKTGEFFTKQNTEAKHSFAEELKGILTPSNETLSIGFRDIVQSLSSSCSQLTNPADQKKVMIEFKGFMKQLNTLLEGKPSEDEMTLATSSVTKLRGSIQNLAPSEDFTGAISAITKEIKEAIHSKLGKIYDEAAASLEFVEDQVLQDQEVQNFYLHLILEEQFQRPLVPANPIEVDTNSTEFFNSVWDDIDNNESENGDDSDNKSVSSNGTISTSVSNVSHNTYTEDEC